MEQNSEYHINEQGKVVLENGIELNMTPDDYEYMQVLHRYLMEILLTVDKFCRENSITYYLGEGTLLGAIRHGGFVPWDDDVDILLPREDYDRFLKLAEKSFPEGFVLDCFATNKKHYGIAKIEMTKKLPLIKRRQHGILLHSGPAIDLFPIDYVPDVNDKRLSKRGTKIRLIRRVLWIKSGLHKKTVYKSKKRRLMIYYPLKFYSHFRTMAGMHKQLRALMTETNDQPHNYSTVFESLYYTRRETFKTEYFGSPRMVSFCGHELPVPKKAEKILTRIYGDYMLMPPVSSRKSKHSFDFDDKVLQSMKGTKDYEILCRARDAAKEKKSAPKKDPVATVRKKKTSKFGRILKRFTKKAAKLKKSLRLNHRAAVIYKYSKKPIAEKTVFYDAFSGLGVLDSPRAIFKNLLKREDFRDYTHVFAINDMKTARDNMAEFQHLSNVKFVKRRSAEYAKYVCTAKYLICNSSLLPFFGRRPEQVYLETWHGVPSKVMGFERPGQRVGATMYAEHNFLNATHLVAANGFTGERMFKKAYMLDGLYEGELLNEPLPRTDLLVNTTRQEALNKLKTAGIYTDKKIVVYAPTWKGKLYNQLDYDLDELKNAVKLLKDRIDTSKYEVFLRVHYFVYNEVAKDEELRKISIPFTVDTDEMLAATDILISDYSSIFFDFLSTRRPILFYVPDIDDYTENRGLYIPMEKMPGPAHRTLDGIAESINHIDEVQKEYRDRYEAMRAWCSSKEDGHAADRIIDAVFYGKKGDTLSCKQEKIKIAFLADFGAPFIHEYELMKLFERLDYEKFDVTLITGKPKKSNVDYLENIQRNVRILVYDKNINVPKFKKKRILKAFSSGKLSAKEAADRLNMVHEYRKTTGGVQFDAMITVRPETAKSNWLLFGLSANAKAKYLLNSEPVKKDLFQRKATKKQFCDTFNSVEELEAVIDELSKKQ